MYYTCSCHTHLPPAPDTPSAWIPSARIWKWMCPLPVEGIYTAASFEARPFLAVRPTRHVLHHRGEWACSKADNSRDWYLSTRWFPFRTGCPPWSCLKTEGLSSCHLWGDLMLGPCNILAWCLCQLLARRNCVSQEGLFSAEWSFHSHYIGIFQLDLRTWCYRQRWHDLRGIAWICLCQANLGAFGKSWLWRRLFLFRWLEISACTFARSICRLFQRGRHSVRQQKGQISNLRLESRGRICTCRDLFFPLEWPWEEIGRFHLFRLGWRDLVDFQNQYIQRGAMLPYYYIRNQIIE